MSIQLHPRPPAPPEVSASGLPGWCCVVLDAVIGSGVIRPPDLDDLSTDDLTALAGAVVRSWTGDKPLDVRGAAAELRRATAELEAEDAA